MYRTINNKTDISRSNLTLLELCKYGLGLHQVTKTHSELEQGEEEVPLTATSIHEHNLRLRNLRLEGLTNTQIDVCNNYKVLYITISNIVLINNIII